jgi:phospholipase/carboxylesterase
MTAPSLTGPSSAPAHGKPTSLVILLHGYGSNGDDLIGLVPYWRGVLPDTLFVSPNAPQPLPGSVGGYQWWALDSLAPAARAAGVRVSAAVLNAFIDEQLAATGLSEDKLALVGFSQGTMMALHVGPRRKKQIAGIVGYSGMLADPDALAAEVKTKPPVLLVHGDADQVLPVVSIVEAERRLKVLGFDVATHVSPGLTHSIDEIGLQLGARFLVDNLAK